MHCLDLECTVPSQCTPVPTDAPPGTNLIRNAAVVKLIREAGVGLIGGEKQYDRKTNCTVCTCVRPCTTGT